MPLHAPPDYICPFCLLLQGIENEHVYSVQADILYRDARVTAFMSSHQVATCPGNVLVIPNQHFENLYELPVDLAGNLQRVVKAVALAQKAAFGCEGVSTRQHNEPAGYQDVWHYHIHVTPRYHGDGLYGARREFMLPEERLRYTNRLKPYLQEERAQW